MKRIAQEARMRQGVVTYAEKKGKSAAAVKYGVSLSSVKRWVKRYDGTWQSLEERSHRPNSHPKQHTHDEEKTIRYVFADKYIRYGWDGVYAELRKNHGYRRSFSGMYHAATRMGLGWGKKRKRPSRTGRRYPDLATPGEKVQIDVKEVPYNCLTASAKRDERRFYQWTAIDECTRFRFVYGYEEHTPENSVDFWDRVKKAFPFKIQAVQTDNGTEFTYKYISDEVKCPFESKLEDQGVRHILIPPRTPWKNGKVERSHRNDQRYFYDFVKVGGAADLNEKLRAHLHWSNNKPMRTLGWISPADLLFSKFGSHH